MREINLGQGAIEWALEAASKLNDRWKDNPEGRHYQDKLSTHFVGKLGEIAVEALLLERHPEALVFAHFRQPSLDSFCDIEVVSPFFAKIDVKSWSAQYWRDLGRCVAISQLEELRAKADCIVWAVTPNLNGRSLFEAADNTVVIKGWSLLEDLGEAKRGFTGITGREMIDNLQLREDQLRDIETLLTRTKN